jgi:hypothetical protein
MAVLNGTTITDYGAGHYGKFWLFKSSIAGYRSARAAANLEVGSNGILD